MMNLYLETTTGLLVPQGVAPCMRRGGIEVVFLQFLTNGVAGLQAGGAPIALKLYQPTDLVNPIATLNAFTASAPDVGYLGNLDTIPVALASVISATLQAKISYANPNVDSQVFHVRYGLQGSGGGAPAVQIVITQPTGPVNYVQDIGDFGGRVALNQTEGFWRVKAPCNLLGLQLNCQDAPTGADLLVDVLKGGVAQNKVAKLTAASKSEETIFGVPLALQIGDVVQFKPTQVGSTKAGTNLTVKGIVQLL